MVFLVRPSFSDLDKVKIGQGTARWGKGGTKSVRKEDKGYCGK
jgi:hypothetical protein